MSDLDDFRNNSNRSKYNLHKIAVALGCSTEIFSDPTLSEHGQTVELLQLWLMIDGFQDREKILMMLRSVCSKAQTPGEPVALAHTVHQPE